MSRSEQIVRSDEIKRSDQIRSQATKTGMIRLCRPIEHSAQIQSTKSVSTTTDSQYNLRKARPWRPKSATDRGGAQRAKAIAWDS